MPLPFFQLLDPPAHDLLETRLRQRLSRSDLSETCFLLSVYRDVFVCMLLIYFNVVLLHWHL